MYVLRHIVNKPIHPYKVLVRRDAGSRQRTGLARIGTSQVPVTLPGTSYFLTRWMMEKLISEILGHTNRQAATHLTREGAVPNAKWHTSQIIRGPHAGPFTSYQNLQLGALGRILKRHGGSFGGGKPSRASGPRWRDLVSPLGFHGNEGWPVSLQGPRLALYWHCTQPHPQGIVL